MLMDPPALTECEQEILISPTTAPEVVGAYQMQHEHEHDSYGRSLNPAPTVAPKGIYGKMRPISAKPNTIDYRHGISEAPSE
mmetsp:Transcript_28339/g.35060  ORF Transcript_28339/g.35060 Transcript_28339/m.35060 type:complete len:82 (-) Transcript_28339:1107-1352(-)